MLINFDKTIELLYDALFKLGSIQNQEYQAIQSFWRKACHSFLINSGYLPTGQDCKPDIHCNDRWWRETLPVLHSARSTFLGVSQWSTGS